MTRFFTRYEDWDELLHHETPWYKQIAIDMMTPRMKLSAMRSSNPNWSASLFWLIIVFISVLAAIPSSIRTFIYVKWLRGDTEKTRSRLPCAHIMQLIFDFIIAALCLVIGDWPIGEAYYNTWGATYVFDVLCSVALIYVSKKYI